MSIFQCERCGCAENTACGVGMFYHAPSSFDWSYAPELEGKRLCSACGPTLLKGGHPTITEGQWHGVFRRMFLPMGLFKADPQGNLAHIETGETSIEKYELKRDKFPVVRPLAARHIHVWDDTDGYLGIGQSVTRESGIALLVNARVYDSNHVMYWSYADEQNQPG